MKVTVVIPVFNEERYLSECLDSICYGQDFDDYEVLVVDNGSTDRSIEIARKFPVKILEKIGVRVGGVRNYGVEHAEGEIIAFLDSDCVADKKWISRGVDHLNQGWSAVGGLYLLRDSPSWVEKYWILQNSSDSEAYQKTFVGGCLFIHRNVFDSVGGFNSRLAAGEDSDLTSRLSERGFRINIFTDLNVIHLGFPDSLYSFIRRQIWHSGDAYQKLPAILIDKTFILTHLFLFGFVFFLILVLAYGFVFPAIIALAIWLGVPIIFSLKRLLRCSGRRFRVREYLMIYFIDFSYLLGRVLGLWSSFKKFVKVDSRFKN